MLDWPEPTHTSPTSTSRTVRSLTDISSGPAAESGRSQSSHFPSGRAVVETFCPWKPTLTVSPGSAAPHMRTGIPCCNTMWSEIKAGSLTAP